MPLLGREAFARQGLLGGPGDHRDEALLMVCGQARHRYFIFGRDKIIKPLPVIFDAQRFYSLEIPVNNMDVGQYIQFKLNRQPFADVQFGKGSGFY